MKYGGLIFNGIIRLGEWFRAIINGIEVVLTIGEVEEMRLRNSQQSNSSNGFMRSAISLSTLYQLFQSRRRNVWTYLLPSTKPGLHTMTKKTDDILDKALEGLSLDQEFKDQQHPLCRVGRYLMGHGT